MHDIPLSVSDLNHLVRQTLEQTLPICWVSGEISNWVRASSGHWYFTLKDSGSNVRCVMFRNRNQFVAWLPKEGQHVEVHAQATLYEARGDFQLTVEAVRHAGQGALFEAFLRLKAKLEQEGLFDSTRKRPLPAYPTSIGLITSPQGAAVHDALTMLQRRWPMAGVIVYPVSVQGDAAPAQIVAALEMAQSRRECDVLLLIRGGGSLEDLQAFNDEAVARAMAGCSLPICTGIGHETDFTIADFVADLRAPTPTAAAQMATPDRMVLNDRRIELQRNLSGQMHRHTSSLSQSLDRLHQSLKQPHERLAAAKARLEHFVHRLLGWRDRVFTSPSNAIRALTYRLIHLNQYRLMIKHDLKQLDNRLASAMKTGLDHRRMLIDRLAEQLELLSPRAVLARGYALVRDSAGQVIRSPLQLHDRQLIEIELADGNVSASVTLG